MRDRPIVDGPPTLLVYSRWRQIRFSCSWWYYCTVKASWRAASVRWMSCAASALWLASGYAKDVSGSSDHPALSRIAGSTIVVYERKD